MFYHSIGLWYLCPGGKNMSLLMLMPVNVEVTWTRKPTEREQRLLCRASLRGKPRSGRVDVEAPERQLYRHSWSDGSGGPVSRGKDQWSFPSTSSCPLSIRMLSEAQSQSWMAFMEEFTEGKTLEGLMWSLKLCPSVIFFSVKELLLLKQDLGMIILKWIQIFFCFYFGDLMNYSCIIHFLRFFLFYLPLSW